MNYFSKILIVLVLLTIQSSAIFAQKGGTLAVEYKKKLIVEGPGEWINISGYFFQRREQRRHPLIFPTTAMECMCCVFKPTKARSIKK